MKVYSQTSDVTEHQRSNLNAFRRGGLLLLGVLLIPFLATAQRKTAAKAETRKITTPREAFGVNVGDDYQMINYTKMVAYWKTLASESDRMKLVEIGTTEEGRPQYMAIVSSPENIKKLDRYKEISQKLAHAEGLTEEQAHALADEGKAIVWIDGGLHANETVGSQQLIEMVYQMCSRTDPETMRFLNDDIGLYVLANPDGQELVANWYMREADEKKRSLAQLPRLFQKYIGHDDNRDSLTSNMAETTNMNKQLYVEWNPQLMYNHHQSGPAGEIIFIPPFRDPVNHNLDPLVTLGIEEMGTAMHERLVEQGKGGSGMRTQANYDGWWDGGMRNTTTFHNTIAILTEIVGGPTPMEIPLIPEKQLYISDLPLPVGPQTWHYRQSIDYEIENNRAMLDYASRKRDVLLYNFYRMGKNSIERGSGDYWTVTPKRIDALEEAAAKMGTTARRGPGGGDSAAEPAAVAAGAGSLATAPVPSSLYKTVLHDPNDRDARGYILSASQPDFPTVTTFINSLEKSGLTVMQATAPFTVNGKRYPTGSYVVKAAQAFRPMVREMFEPQDHPHDARYPGGPPVPPYDVAGWTLAMQMGVQYDRVYEGFDGPFQVVKGIQKPLAGSIVGAASPAGYLISHRVNNSYILVNRLMKARADVYWLKKSPEVAGLDLGTGAIWVPASAAALPILQAGARDLGMTIVGVASAPAGDALKLAPIRIGLYDQYGGIIPSGWMRWLLEHYEFPFEVVYPKTLDAGNLNAKFDVLVFSDGAYRRAIAGAGRGGGGGGGAGRGGANLQSDIPVEFQAWQGRVSEETTLPEIMKFVEAGGSVVAVGSSSGMAEVFGLPISNYLTEQGPDGKDRQLGREKFYIPGSLVKTEIDNTQPLAYGMPSSVDVFFENSPVFKLAPNAAQRKTSAVAWFSTSTPLDSGWAWGESYLNGGTAVVDAKLGKGKVMVMGPEVTFRGEPHATFKLFFNGLYYSNAQSSTVQ